MSSARIHVVEDDAAVRRGLVDALQYAQYGVTSSEDGEAGLHAALHADIDLLLLDLMMPKRDGFSVLEELRRVRPTLPVIILTARGAEEDRVRGLESGADDYVVKPFSARELLARVEAVLRRSPQRSVSIGRVTTLGVTIDLDRQEVIREDGSRANLGDRDREILRHLMSRPDAVVSRDELLDAVWGFDPRGVHTRSVDMAVARLRERLGAKGAEIIETVRGQGYRLAPFTAEPGNEE
ncbi:MAG: response regulator transcription factor [Planctomycetota bacterium]